MAEYYVDVSISGGNGTDPSTAFPSVLSVALANGDRMWVRRTHTEVLANSVVPGHFNVTDASKAQYAFVIGWPNSGDPFYDTRPSAGRTPWDGDNAATVQANSYGFNAPTLACSGASSSRGITLGMGLTIANMFINNIEAAGHTAIKNMAAGALMWRPALENVFFVHSSGPHGSRWTQNGAITIRMGKITWAFSFSNTTQGAFPAVTWYCDHVVIHSLSIIDAAMFSSEDARNFHVGLLEIFTTSLAYMWRSATTTDKTMMDVVERIRGSEPYSGFDNTNDANTKLFACNDYYGRGPMIATGRTHKVLGRLVSSADGMHSTGRAWLWDIASIAAANQNYAGGYQAHRFLRKFFNVTSGTALDIYVPVYIGSSAVYSVGMQRTRMHLMAAGGMPRNLTDSMVSAGSYSNWSGTYIAGGSAYLYKTTWTPRETGAVPFDVFFGGPVQANSGEGKIGYVLFGEPYSA